MGPSKSRENKYARRKGEAGLHKHSLSMPRPSVAWPEVIMRRLRGVTCIIQSGPPFLFSSLIKTQ